MEACSPRLVFSAHILAGMQVRLPLVSLGQGLLASVELLVFVEGVGCFISGRWEGSFSRIAGWTRCRHDYHPPLLNTVYVAIFLSLS